MPDRDPDQPDINPARLRADPLLAEIADLVGSMDLHIGRHQMKQLTTRQKELWADLVDADAVNTADEDSSLRPARRTVRWWRDYRRPVGEEGHAHGEEAVCRSCGKAVTWDADIEAFWIPYKAGNPKQETYHCPWGERHWALPSGASEPDPFTYPDEPPSDAAAEAGMSSPPRTRGVDQPVHIDEVAVRVARAATLDVTPDHPHWFHRHSDFAAVYEWAKQAVRPLRMSEGERAGDIGSLRAYPSLDATRRFLDRHRTRREAEQSAD